MDVAAKAAEPIPVGAAKLNITPTEPLLLAGYGGRTREHEGVDTPLWARALVIGDENPVALVVLDNCGVPASVVRRIEARLQSSNIPPERLVVAVTHTHNAPTLTGYAPIVWAGRTSKEQDARTAAYTELVVQRSAEVVKQALAAREPLHLEWTRGRATFGGNRRVLRDGQWTGFGFHRSSPVDHGLPILAARNQQGAVRIVWANYACHCTTVGSRNSIGGDWAGFANDALEQRFPEATAITSIGCGADVGPQPSGSLQLAKQHGEHLAAQVALALQQPMTPISTPPTARSRQVRLPLAEPQPREHWERQAESGNGFHRQHALSMLRKLNRDGKLPTHVDYPISCWRFGDQLACVFLGGEVVVDYAVRLNESLDWSRLAVTAWADAMPGYIPSRRVLLEGGYEADFSQIYYDQPGPYAREIESTLVEAVVELVGEAFAAEANQPQAPFHSLPSGAEAAFARLALWVAKPPAQDTTVLRWLRRHAPKARPAVAKLQTLDGQNTEWLNFAGDTASRVFIRQQRADEQVGFRLPESNDDQSESRGVFCFTGGLGWESQPARGFELRVDDLPPVHFDVTRRPQRWANADKTVELVYLPTWTSNVDSGGFFFLRLNHNQDQDHAKSVTIRSRGEGSRRWFAIDRPQSVEDLLPKLCETLR